MGRDRMSHLAHRKAEGTHNAPRERFGQQSRLPPMLLRIAEAHGGGHHAGYLFEPDRGVYHWTGERREWGQKLRGQIPVGSDG
jgi:hypothetical protein